MILTIVLTLLAQPLTSNGNLQMNSCEESCVDCTANSSSPHKEYEACQCDPLCMLYGDCCSEASRVVCNTSYIERASHPPFYCQDSTSTSISVIDKPPSITVGYFFWYWMVTVCPDDWVLTGGAIGQELRLAIKDLCINTTQRLPPATDMNTGFDYRNEYCAICNGVNPQHIIRWEYDYQCKPEYRKLIQNTANYILTEEDLETFCSFKNPQKPSFNLLSTGDPSPPERPCYPMRPPSCLDRDTLQNITGVEWNETKYQTVLAKCFGTTQIPVIHHLLWFELPFRNIDCALCNGYRQDELSCFNPDIIIGNIIGELPFSVLLDINRDGMILISSEFINTTVQVSCSSTEVYDPVIRGCRGIELQDCIQKANNGATLAVLVNGECVTSDCKKQLLPLNDSNTFSFHNSTAVNYSGEMFIIEYTNAQGEPVICVDSSGALVVVCNGSLISLNDSDMFSFLNASSIMYGGEVYKVEFNNSLGEPVICVNFSNNGTLETNTTIENYGYPIGYFVLTYIGCSLSVIGCVLVLLTYSLFKELQTLPSKLLINLTVAILITNLLIPLGGPVAEAFPDVVDLCVAITILLHFFFLSQFSWMSIMSMEMARTFYQAYKLRAKETERSKCVIFTAYFITGWSLPMLISVTTIAVNFSTNLVLYGVFEDGTRGSCWINHVQSAIVAILVPVAISLALNTVMFVITCLLLISTCKSQVQMKKIGKSNVSYFRLSIAIFTISGLTWGFGLIVILVRAPWTWYLFIALNSIQGFVVFLAFLCTKKVMRLYLSPLTGRSVTTNQLLVEH